MNVNSIALPLIRLDLTIEEAQRLEDYLNLAVGKIKDRGGVMKELSVQLGNVVPPIRVYDDERN